MTAVTILALPHEELAASSAPLLRVAEEADWLSTDLFAAIALVAVANGVLIELVMLARPLYGMTRRGWLPAWLGTVHPRLRTPIPATLCGGAAVFVLTVAVPFLHLVALTSTGRRSRQCCAGGGAVSGLRSRRLISCAVGTMLP